MEVPGELADRLRLITPRRDPPDERDLAENLGDRVYEPYGVRCGTSCRTVARRDRAYDLVFVRQLKPEDHEHRVGDGLTPA